MEPTEPGLSDPQESPVIYICSQELVRISSLLPSNKRRSLLVHSLIKASGLMEPSYSPHRKLLVVSPRRANYKDLANYHAKDYLDVVLNYQDDNATTTPQDSYAEFGLEDDCPPFVGLPDYMQLVGGASLTAVGALRANLTDTAICWDGGRHHARKDRASGFCYVADCILAILALKKHSNQVSTSLPTPPPRVMYLDLDLHFSDAVSEAFWSPGSTRKNILTFSIHHSAPGFYPVSDRAALPDPSDPNLDPYTLSIPLAQGASNATYARIWRQVEDVRKAFSPDYVIVQCGADALAEDPCAMFNWSIGPDIGSLGWCIQQVMDWPAKKLLLGGGGYNSPNTARSWAYLTSIALKKPLDLEGPIPDHDSFPLYGPSFTFEVPPGNMADRNTPEYLDEVEDTYRQVLDVLRRNLRASEAQTRTFNAPSG